MRRDPIADLLNLHHVLEVEHDDGDKGNFLFGWQCENPFANDLLAATRERSLALNHTQYSYLEEDFALANKIRQAHHELDGVAPKDVFCGAGATALLVAFAAYLRNKNIREVYFLSPIYFSAHFAFRLFGIRARRISKHHAFEADFKMNLPRKEAVLIITDPIWYAADLRDFRKWLKADVAIGDVSLALLKEYLEDMVGSRKLTVATVRRRFACLRAFFRRACEKLDCPDPFANWRPLLPRRKRLPRTLSRGEAIFLLSSRNADMERAGDGDQVFRTIVQLMVGTGMRVGELCKLKLDDLSPDCSTVRIQGKGARDRVAYVTDPGLRKDLHRLIAHRRNSQLGASALFVNRYGAQMRPQSVRSKLRRLAKDAGLARRVTPHMLRHTAATLLIETGVDIRFVQRLLGHSSIATTEIYTHVSDEALRATLERADVLGTLSSG